MAEEGTNVNPGENTNTDPGFGGTGYSSPEELAQAFIALKDQHSNLEKKLGEQGNELGTLRKDNEFKGSQLETLSALLKDTVRPQQQSTAPAVNYSAEIDAAKEELRNLDTLDPKFVSRQAELIGLISDLTAKDVHEKTLSAASKVFKEELSKRDAESAKSQFYKDNPDFKDPQMQMRIKNFIANDPTGLHDPMSAYFQIKLGDMSGLTTTLQQENQEYKRLVDLAKGKDETGKVVVKPQTPTVTTETKPQKLSGKALDEGMMGALQSYLTKS